VPLTSTPRHNFGTRDVQVNQLASRIAGIRASTTSGTYRRCVLMQSRSQGSGPLRVGLSHPTAPGKKAIHRLLRSIGIENQASGYREVHVGMQSGESLSLRFTQTFLPPGVNNPLRVEAGLSR